MTTPAPHPTPAAPSVRREGDTMTAQRLRDAAKVLRESAEAAGGAVGHTTWTRDGVQGRGDGLCWDVGNGEGHVVACTDFEEVHDFVAAMNLDVGLALADWLDIGATNAEKNGWQPGYMEALEHTPALRIADLILGGAA